MDFNFINKLNNEDLEEVMENHKNMMIDNYIKNLGATITLLKYKVAEYIKIRENIKFISLYEKFSCGLDKYKFYLLIIAPLENEMVIECIDPNEILNLSSLIIKSRKRGN